MAINPEVVGRLEVVDDMMTMTRYYLDPANDTGTTYEGKTVVASILHEELRRHPEAEGLMLDKLFKGVERWH